MADANHKILNFKNILLLTNFQGTVKCIEVLFLHIKITEDETQQMYMYMYLPVEHMWLTCEINKTLLTRYFMALFITLGLISRPSAKMLSLAQHPDYAQHLSVYAVSCTVPKGSSESIYRRRTDNTMATRFKTFMSESIVRFKRPIN